MRTDFVTHLLYVQEFTNAYVGIKISFLWERSMSGSLLYYSVLNVAMKSKNNNFAPRNSAENNSVSTQKRKHVL